ncbi:hypothetical protein Bbelb_016230 [Branchiostoma belcheri]|nr:hypothetical protein Bbelb_016230 [Branchiostoma belcheri]
MAEGVVVIPKKEWELIVDRLQCLETRVKQLESNLDAVTGEVSKCNYNNTDLIKSVEYTQENVDELCCRMETQEKEQQNTGKWLSDLELYGRRWNLLFHGVDETEQENCEKKVLDLIDGEMKINTKGMRMCGVHRLGKPQRNRSGTGKPRPIIARFTCRADRENVWRNKTKLKGKRVFITDDVPSNVREIRKRKLVPALKRAKATGKRATIVGDRLVIEGETFVHWKIPQRWLQDEPEAESGKSQETERTAEKRQEDRESGTGTVQNAPEGDTSPDSDGTTREHRRGKVQKRNLRPRPSRGRRR